MRPPGAGETEARLAWPVSPSFPAEDGLPVESLLDPPLHPGEIGSLDRFPIVRVLGVGGMGVVFLAGDPESPNASPTSPSPVAIKLLRPCLAANPQAVRWFLAEAGHMQRLTHPHILPLLEVCEGTTGPYFVMPYLERGSLADLLRPRKPLEPDFTLKVARQMASALRYAHAAGVIHGDVKPANILLDSGGNACLADFGLARTLFGASMAGVKPGPHAGTAPYLSPGMASGEAEDTRSDIYALGAVLYELLTGQPPYLGKSAEQIVEQILQGPPPPILQRNSRVPPGMVSLVEKAMARQLRDRYAHLDDLLADLERIRSDQEAPPKSCCAVCGGI